MFTASHNPAAYNGIKMCRAGARPSARTRAWRDVRERRRAASLDGAPAAAPRRTGDDHDPGLLADYAAYLRALVDLSGIRPLKVVVDAGNGMGGHTVPAVLGTEAGLPALPLDVVPLYFELDGTFPNHEANPLDPANLVDLQAAVVRARRRHRPGLRRRRRPLLRRRRARRAGQPERDHRRWSPAARSAGACRAGRDGDRDPQPDHARARCPRSIAETGGTAACAPASATPSSRPRWPRHDAVFGGEHSRALLLPRLLVRRHRHARRDARAGRARRAGAPAVRAGRRVRAVRRLRRDQLHGRPTSAAADRAGRGRLRRAARRSRTRRPRRR